MSRETKEFSRFRHAQIEICERYRAKFCPADPQSKLGFATRTLGAKPINGLRHPPQGDTNGWYVWCGEELSTAPDFFEPLHAVHLVTSCSAIIKYLALPPGYRFLMADDHEDVWFDATLLHA